MCRQNRTAAIFSHPYLLLALGCLLVFLAFPSGKADGTFSAGSVLLLACCAAAGGGLFFFSAEPANSGFSCTQRVAGAALSAGILCCVSLLTLQTSYPLPTLALLWLVVLTLSGIRLYVSHRLTARNVCILLGIGAFLLRALYILYTAYNIRQHDVFDISSNEGHQAYILYFAEHNFQLPNFSPTSVWEFYHPPLHYFLSALWVKLQTLLGFGTAAAIENVQLLTLFYSCATVILGYRILRALHFDGPALALPFAILCFHPTLILLSGSINNDMLCITLSFAAILYAIRWYQNASVKNILLLGASLGLAMMAKSSGALVAPAVAVLFLIKLIKSKGKRGKLWGQFGLFLLVCAPLGLWWTVYSKLRFGVSPGSISSLTPDNPQYLGAYSTLQRFFGIDWQHLSIFENWGWSNKAFEYNLFTTIWKSSVFDEFTFFTSGSGLAFANLLFWGNILLSLAALVCMIYTAVSAAKGSSPLQSGTVSYRSAVLFFAVLYLTYLIFYIWFCFSQPYACTQSFRYIFPTVLAGAVGMGTVLRPGCRPAAEARSLTFALSLLVTLFCVGSAGTYLLLGTVQ